MKNKISFYLTLAFAVFAFSCSHSDDNYYVPVAQPATDSAPLYVGTYSMSSACFTASPQSVIVTANGTNSINLPVIVGTSGCQYSHIIQVSVNGNNIVSQTVDLSDDCAHTYHVTVSGSLSGSTLTLHYTAPAPAGLSTAYDCTFSGPNTI